MKRIGPPMNMKLQAEKQAHPGGILVGMPCLRMMVPALLPTRASPPGDLSQISSTGSYCLSASASRVAASASIIPSALRIRRASVSNSEKRIWR
jgi:hypothetical protein